jgi:hypothetical protein
MIGGSPHADTEGCWGVVPTASRPLTAWGQEMEEQAGSSASGASATSGALAHAVVEKSAAQSAAHAATRRNPNVTTWRPRTS